MKRIILCGGGSLGPVTPLLAVKQELENQHNNDISFLWVGTKAGIEGEFIKRNFNKNKKIGLPFVSINSGKLRRYFSWQNFIDPFLVIAGFFESLKIIFKFKPDVIITAGGFVCLPLALAGWFIQVPIVVHQLDLKVGLTNKILKYFATVINVSFSQNIKNFPLNKVINLGNPIRKEIFLGDVAKVIKKYNIDKSVPTVLILGGGTGSIGLNDIAFNSANSLSEFTNIIHITGKNKAEYKLGQYKNKYIIEEFIAEGIEDLFAIADVVITRAGLATLSELLVLHKPMIIIPIPNNQQEVNASYIKSCEAGIVLDESILTSEELVRIVKEILENSSFRNHLQENTKGIMPINAAVELAKVCSNL